MKRCARCKKEKVESEFSKDRSKNDSLNTYCRACKKSIHFEFAYGLTHEQWELMWALQEERCKLCRSPLHERTTKGCHVDHEKGTGRVRGLLCGECNTLVGALEKSFTLGWAMPDGELFQYLVSDFDGRLL